MDLIAFLLLSWTSFLAEFFFVLLRNILFILSWIPFILWLNLISHVAALYSSRW